MGIWGQGKALVCIDTETGKLQRYLRAPAGHPIHAGRAYVEMAAGEMLVPVIEAFRADPDQFAVEPEAA
mgnify:CR=1 FL=1